MAFSDHLQYEVIVPTLEESLTCKLKAMYRDTLPEDMVPTATNLPSEETLRAESVSQTGANFFKDVEAGSHICRYDGNLVALPTGFVSTKSLVSSLPPSTVPNLQRLDTAVDMSCG